MPRLEPSIRYLAFYRALGGTSEGTPEWRAIAAGLLTLRLVDTWLGGGTPLTASVDAAVRAVDAADPARAALSALVSLVGSGDAEPDVTTVAPAILRYAEVLKFAGNYELMSDAASCLAANARPGRHTDLAIDATLATARGARMASRFDAAATAYQRAERVAREHGRLAGVLRAQLGLAQIDLERGRLGEAERAITTVLRRARAHDLSPVVTLALGDLGRVLHQRGDVEGAIRLNFQAFQLATSSADRTRFLSNIATAFGVMGARAAARDTQLVMIATTADHGTRWIGLINLMELASLDGQLEAFEGYRRELDAAALSPWIRANFLLHVGEAYGRAGRIDEARAALGDAIGVCEAHRFNRVLFQVERARSALADASRSAPTSTTPPASLLDVVDAIANLREQAGSPTAV